MVEPLPRYKTIEGGEEKLKNTTQINTGPANPKVVSTDEDGFLDPSLLRDGEVFDRLSSEVIASRAVVNVFDDTAVAKVRNADATVLGTRAIGFVQVGVADATVARIKSEGIVTGFVGLTIGVPVFLSETPGLISETPIDPIDEAGTGKIHQKVGFNISATEVRIEIDNPVIL